MNLKNSILTTLLQFDPRSLSPRELELNLGASDTAIRSALNCLYREGLLTPIAVHPPNPGYAPNAALTVLGRAHAAALPGEDLGDVSDHLLREVRS